MKIDDFRRKVTQKYNLKNEDDLKDEGNHKDEEDPKKDNLKSEDEA